MLSGLLKTMYHNKNLNKKMKYQPLPVAVQLNVTFYSNTHFSLLMI